MEVKIIKVYELNGILRIETETKYGKDNIGLSLEARYLNPATQKPKYIEEVASLLKRRYEPGKAVKKPIDKSMWGKKINL